MKCSRIARQPALIAFLLAITACTPASPIVELVSGPNVMWHEREDPFLHDTPGVPALDSTVRRHEAYPTEE